MPCHTEVVDEGPKYSQMLCYLCTCMDRGDKFVDALCGNSELRQWWYRHQAADAARLKAERENVQIAEAKRSALGKLTPDERALLGFNGE